MLLGISAQVLAQIDRAIVTEARDRTSSVCVESEQIVHHPGYDAPAIAVAPIHESSSRAGKLSSRNNLAVQTRIEPPALLPGRRVESNDVQTGRIAKQRATDDEWIRFGVAGLLPANTPGLPQLSNIVGRDLGERRIEVAGCMELGLPLGTSG